MSFSHASGKAGPYGRPSARAGFWSRLRRLLPPVTFVSQADEDASLAALCEATERAPARAAWTGRRHSR